MYRYEQLKFAVIFDMDGVIVDNISYHLKAWKEFCNKYSINLSDDEFNKNISGKSNKDILKYIFKKELNPDEIKKYADEKETMYRKLYSKHIEPRTGLINFLKMLKQNNIKTAIATSAPKINLDFILKSIEIEEYFDILVYEDMVSKGKPDPEIYLKAANLLGIEPKQCIVIEDALSGIKSGLNAGMKVIGMTTVHKKEELTNTNLVIDDFEGLVIEKLRVLFE